MQANLENVGTLERRLSVAVPMAEIDQEIDTRLKKLSRTVKMHGFRPGKVPLKVVQQQYGLQVRQEVLGDALQRSFGEAVRQQNLRVAGYPRFEPKPLSDGASDFEYSATFEVYPEVALGDVASARIERPQLEVSDAELEKTLDIMRKQRVAYDPVERPAQKEDRLTLSYEGTIDGTEFPGGKAENQTVVLGEGRLLNDFETQLAGMKAGEAKSFELRFPDDYHGKDVAGKTATFNVSVSEVAAPRLPEIDAEFAKGLGIADGDIEKMREEVRTNVDREVKHRLKARLKDQVMQLLLDTTSVEVPKALVEGEVERLRDLMRQDFTARGIPVKDDSPLPAELFEKQAQRRVTLGLILAEVVKAHQLQAKPEQVKAIVEEQAQAYEHPQEVVRFYYQNPDRLREIESMVLEDNVVEWALKTAQVEEKPVDFDELMGNRR
jgi:trigger factor